MKNVAKLNSMKNENINLKIHLNCVNGGLDKFSLLLRKGCPSLSIQGLSKI